MESMKDMQNDLAKAVLIWTGYGQAPYPARNDRLVIEVFGVDRGEKLISLMVKLKDEFYLSEAKFTATNLSIMGDAAIEEFKNRHPGFNESVSIAFAWCYTYDYK